MADDDTRRRELEARNAGLRTQIDSMLSDLQRRTEELQEKQAEAAGMSQQVSSEDGTVTAKVDATGTLEQLTLDPEAFERTTPERLARTITSVIREASGGAKQAVQAQFQPMADDVPELSEFVPGAPSLQGLLRCGPLVEPPDPAAERAQRSSEPSAPRQQTQPRPRPGRRDEDFDDGPPESFLTGRR